jgi:hypothetical protein
MHSCEIGAGMQFVMMQFLLYHTFMKPYMMRLHDEIKWPYYGGVGYIWYTCFDFLSCIEFIDGTFIKICNP